MTGGREIKPAAFRPGQRLTVVDATAYAIARGKLVTPPFTVGDTVDCVSASPHAVLIKGDDRFWKPARFVAAT